MEKYYDIQDKELLDKYTDIKVLKELKPFRVVCYCYYGLEPENGAFSVMSGWLKRSGLSFVFEGGQYAYEEVEWNNNGKRWFQFIDWIKMSKKYDFDNRPFMEECIIDSPALKPTTRVKHYMPVNNK